MTGGRIRRIKPYVGNETFMLTYGDGVADVNVTELLNFHRSHGKLATLTAVQPVGRFGSIHVNGDNLIRHFEEKIKGDGAWMNGGFFVLEPGIFDYISDDTTTWEQEPMRKLCLLEQLAAFKHQGFWMCMDTLRDKLELESLWETKKCPWRIWNETQ